MRFLLCALLLLATLYPVDCKKRNNRRVSSRKNECERGQCASVNEDDFGNCVLRCQSSVCYAEVYGAEELEPGEVDHKRSRLFTTCVNAEQRKAGRSGRAATVEEPLM